MTRTTILQRGRWAAVLAITGATLLAGASPAQADVAPAPTPRPRIEVPPATEPQNCHWKSGWRLREDGPPVPFLIWVCD